MKTDLINKSQIFSREELKEIRGGDYGYSGDGSGYCHAQMQDNVNNATTPFYTGQRCDNSSFCTQGHTGFEEWFQKGTLIGYTCESSIQHY